MSYRLIRVAALASALFTCALWGSKGSAQNCEPPSNVSFNFISPPMVDILDRESARWSTDAGIRFGFTGDWCPIPEDIVFEDDMGNAIPAVIYFNVITQLVENGPIPPQVGLLKPLMSLEPSTDYTFILDPPNPSLATFSEYTLNFRTGRSALDVDYDTFEGMGTVEIDGNLCEGEGLYISDSESFDCITPSFLVLRASFKPLPNHEVGYLVYRTSSIPTDPDAGTDLIDEVERPLAFLPGVSEERAQRSIDVSFPVLYAPFPREECYKVVAIDEWGRERSGFNEEKCVTLIKPSACSDAQFPEPNPFENTPPIEALSCETLGINGASSNTPIPQVVDENEMEEEDMEEEEDMTEESSGSEEDGCEQSRPSLVNPFSILLLMALICLTRQRLSSTLRP